MSKRESKRLSSALEADPKSSGFGAPQPASSRRDKRRSVSPALPADLAKDVIAAAQGIRDRHKELFRADRKMKDRAARLFRTLLPPRPGRPGRKPITSVTVAMRLHAKLTKELPTAIAEQIWAKIYPKAIPNYASLSNEERWIAQHQLRDRVHSRRLWWRKRKQRDRAA